MRRGSYIFADGSANSLEYKYCVKNYWTFTAAQQKASALWSSTSYSFTCLTAPTFHHAWKICWHLADFRKQQFWQLPGVHRWVNLIFKHVHTLWTLISQNWPALSHKVGKQDITARPGHNLTLVFAYLKIYTHIRVNICRPQKIDTCLL